MQSGDSAGGARWPVLKGDAAGGNQTAGGPHRWGAVDWISPVGPNVSGVLVNEDQSALAQWIAAGLAISEVRALRGDAGFLLNNMIAKYSLAADSYLVSEAAASQLDILGVGWDEQHKRSRFYGKESPFIYEHAIPAGVVRERLLQDHQTLDEVVRTLDMAGPVAVLLRSEDRVMNQSGLRASMPAGWSWGSDPLARYHVAGIKMSDRRLLVLGAICR